ncbi:MAG: DUF5642 family protein [Mycobacterium sp.]
MPHNSFRRHPSTGRFHAIVIVLAIVLVIQTGVAAVWLGNRPSSPTTNTARLDRVHDVADRFPPGFKVTQTDTVTVTQAYLDKLHAPMAGALFIPSECGGEANSASPLPLGATMEGLRGESAQQLVTVAALESPAPMSVNPVPPQCAAVAFVKQGSVRGFSTRIEPPPVKSSLMTQAMRVTATVTPPGEQPVDTVQYVYSALLDNRHVVAVTVTGIPTPGQPDDADSALARSLLAAAVDAVRTA